MSEQRNHKDLQQAVEIVVSETEGRAIEVELAQDGDRFFATISGYGTRAGNSYWEPLVQLADEMLADPTIEESSKAMLRAEVSRAPTLPPAAPKAPVAPPSPPEPPSPPAPPAPPAPPVSAPPSAPEPPTAIKAEKSPDEVTTTVIAPSIASVDPSESTSDGSSTAAE